MRSDRLLPPLLVLALCVPFTGYAAFTLADGAQAPDPVVDRGARVEPASG